MPNQTFRAPSPESMNELLPAYDFVSLLAANHYEAVYVASQKSLERHVAVKVYSPHLSGQQDFKQVFEAMARQMAKLNHSNLIGVFNSGVVGGMFYLAMEFVAGRSLEQCMQGKSLQGPHAASLMDGICNGLMHAHENAIFHGGLSVSNVLLNQKGEPKVGNFGFSASLPTGEQDPCQRFVAPELASGASQLSVQADIYSLGAMLYEMVTGREHGEDSLPPQLVAGTNDKVYDVWKKATATDPAQRYASVQEFQAAYRQALTRGQATATNRAQGPANGVKPAGSATASRPTAAPVSHRVGFNWKLLRNLVIIGLLLYAIHLAWNRYNNEQAKREAMVAQELAERQKEKDELKAKKAREIADRKMRWEQMQREQLAKAVPKPEIVVTPEPPKEDKHVSLERLRDQLFAGQRSEMPSAAKSIGGSHFMLIYEAMTWPEAARFAEQYGAHIVIPNSDATLEWLQRNLMADFDEAIWLGIAKNGRNSWTLADGVAWLPGQLPQGDGDFVSTAKGGELRADEATTERPFIMQWHQDGSNPGSLIELLKKTRLSISQANPVYPPGTRAYGIRHYLHVHRPLDWQSAADLARLGGGHLMVARGIAETFNLEKMTRDLADQGGIWLGACLKGGRWSWITGEPWGNAKWHQGVVPQKPESALLVYPGQGWQAQDRAEKASGFIIEWSHDAGLSAGQ